MCDDLRLVTGIGGWHIASLRVCDGPHGVRLQKDGAKNNQSVDATCFPTACAVSCSWDTELISKMARGIAQEAKALKIDVMLGPGINIKRSPLCGRNFEYFSEDPVLAGKLAASYINAMQSEGVGTSLKHFAANSQETHRMTSNSLVDERALHEIYLRAFEIAVKSAQPQTVMASYNYVNGTSACENGYLLNKILREKWGFKGLVMSDWGACVNLPACIENGMDVEMPDSLGNHLEDLKAALENGSLKKENFERAVKNIRALEKLHKTDEKNTDISLKNAKIPSEIRNKNHELAVKLEEESAVLLKNDSLLPLKENSKILLIGDLALAPRIQGGGSSHINTQKIDSFVEEFSKYFSVEFCRGYSALTFKISKKLEKKALVAVKKAREENIPVVFVGGLTDIAEGEGYDRETFGMGKNQESLLEKILEITKNVCFVSVGGSPYDMGKVDLCRSVLQLYLGGEGVAKACARLVVGNENPCGKLSESIPFSEKDVPSYGFFARQENQKNQVDDVEYRESIFTGYRYYDSFEKKVRYCFGHGLSYTQFEYSDLAVEKIAPCGYEVKFSIKNTGNFAGSEIAQVYVKNPENDDFRAKRELKAFTKIFLEKGEKKEVKIALDSAAFSVWQEGDFTVIGGEYEIQISASLNDVRLKGKISIEGEKLKCPLSKKCNIPLCQSDFDKIYTYPKTHFSSLKRGEFSLKNSLSQLAPYSAKARLFMAFGKLAVKLMFFTKPFNDPEVQMFYGGIVEGNLDTVCNQSGGLLKRKTMQKLVDSANRVRNQ